MLGSFLSGSSGNQHSKVIFLVKKPKSNIAREVRDAVLKEHFGYTDADIKDLDSKENYVLYTDEKTRVWATIDQVKRWKVNAKNEMEVPMSQESVNFLSAFREQRADFEVFKVGTFITDAEIREKFTEDLKKILNSSGQTRIQALYNLMNTIAGSGASRTQIYQALRFLTNEAGYKNNAFLLLAFAQTTIYRSGAPSIGSSQFNKAQIGEIIKITNENLYDPQTKSALGKISKAEAAAINSWASNLYSQSNAEQEANDRRWIERFLKMKPEERALYRDGDLISINAPKETVMRAPTRNESEYNQNEKNFESQQREWNATDNIGAPQPVKTDHRTSQLFQNPNDTYEKEGWEKKKNRGTNNSYQPKIAPTLKPNDFNPYSRANVWADGYGAVFTLFLEAAKYQKFGARMAVITRYLNEKARLERAIRNERFRLKPPPPEVTLKHIKEFQRYGRISSNPFEKRMIGVTLRQLEGLLEEGYAYYK